MIMNDQHEIYKLYKVFLVDHAFILKAEPFRIRYRDEDSCADLPLVYYLFWSVFTVKCVLDLFHIGVCASTRFEKVLA